MHESVGMSIVLMQSRMSLEPVHASMRESGAWVRTTSAGWQIQCVAHLSAQRRAQCLFKRLRAFRQARLKDKDLWLHRERSRAPQSPPGAPLTPHPGPEGGKIEGSEGATPPP